MPRRGCAKSFVRVAGGETNLLAHANPQLLEGHGTATVRVANTRLGNLNEAAGYLLAYPYGCVEQTSSKLLPLLACDHSPRSCREPRMSSPSNGRWKASSNCWRCRRPLAAWLTGRTVRSRRSGAARMAGSRWPWPSARGCGSWRPAWTRSQPTCGRNSPARPMSGTAWS